MTYQRWMGDPWSGHRVLMGYQKSGWQEIDEVLDHFSEKRNQARRQYRIFVEQGIHQGHWRDFEGGGRVRSLNQNAENGCQGNPGGARVHDERVLGVENLWKSIQGDWLGRDGPKSAKIPLPALVEKVSEWFKVESEDLFLGRRKREVSSARALVSYLAVNKMGYRFSEVGKALKLHPVTVARSLEKGREVFKSYQEQYVSIV